MYNITIVIMEGCELMYCMKCGREIEGQQVFCNDCLATMEQYPVNPNTPVQLPKYKSASGSKKFTRRNAPAPEEIILRQRRIIRNLLVLLLAVCLGASYFVYQYFQPEPVDEEPSPGQSWSVAGDET